MAGDFNLIKAHQAVLYTAGLSSSAKLVAFAVFSFHSRESPKPYPGTAKLQRLTGLSKPTVIRAIKELVDAKVVNVETDQNVHGQRFVFDLEPVMILDRSKNNTGQVEGHKPVKIRSKTGKGTFTNQHQNGSRSTEGIQEGIHKKGSNLAPPSRTQKKPPEQQPEGTAELRDHYVSEFQRTRNAKPEFGSAWGRAMKAFGELVRAHGLAAAKAIVTNALQQTATATYTPKVNPWDIAANANNYKGAVHAPVRAGRIGVQNDSTIDELAEKKARLDAAKAREAETAGQRALGVL